MAGSRLRGNPFYVAVLVVGIVFSLTACAYGVMAFRQLRPDLAAEAPHGLLAWMAQHGDRLLIGELLLLTLATVGAIQTDRFWQRRAELAPRAADDPS